ncbi:MAG: hypothetical protein OHK0039_26110 [Bacteroidia bacterium]
MHCRIAACLLLMWAWSACPLRAQAPYAQRIARLAAVLADRLGAPLPPVVVDTALPVNARYARDTIWMDLPQTGFSSDDDLMSILYHEYLHAGLCYPVALDGETRGLCQLSDSAQPHPHPPWPAPRHLAAPPRLRAGAGPGAGWEVALVSHQKDLLFPKSRPP